MTIGCQRYLFCSQIQIYFSQPEWSFKCSMCLCFLMFSAAKKDIENWIDNYTTALRSAELFKQNNIKQIKSVLPIKSSHATNRPQFTCMEVNKVLIFRSISWNLWRRHSQFVQTSRWILKWLLFRFRKIAVMAEWCFNVH